ncbi:MAG: hypothetical protein RJQ21_06845, partial [Rhodospirillales bacterium]
MRRSLHIIEQLIEAGRRKGLRAGDIAVRAGISPANLSRIRASGRYNADTLERLLAAVDADIRIVSRDRVPPVILSLVTTKLNAGRRERISPEDLLQLLTKFRRSKLAERAYSHLVGVIEELSVEQLHDLVMEGSATLPSLRRITEYVDGHGPVADW